MTITERMFIVMEQKGIRAVDLAEKIGASKSLISTWKKRNTDPPANMLVKICELLGVSLNYLVTGCDETPTAEILSPGEKAIYDQVHPLSEADKFKLAGALPFIRMMQDTPYVAPIPERERAAIGLFTGSISRE